MKTSHLRPVCAFCFAAGILAACTGEQAGSAAPPAPLVKVMEIKAVDTPYPGQYQGQTQGSREAQVVARVQGVIRERVYTEGDMVREGDPLFHLEPDMYKAAVDNAKGALAQAEARLDRATREWERVRPLYAKNAVSEKDRDNALSEYNEARANVVAAKAGLQTAQINLDYCSVLSPVTGIAGREVYTAGNYVTNGQVLTSVNRIDPIYVNFYAPGAYMMRLKQLESEGRLTVPEGGFGARLRLLNGMMYEHEGRVTFVDKQVDPSTGTVKMRAEFPNPQGSVLPGQFARVFMQGAVLKNAVLIPQKAVLQTQRGDLVMVVSRENTIEPRPVRLAEAVDKAFLVEKGLAPGERIVTEGIIKVRPGRPVRVENGGAAGGGEEPGGAGRGK
jgi:membrane fusion protein (multidrug efflux system)